MVISTVYGVVKRSPEAVKAKGNSWSTIKLKQPPPWGNLQDWPGVSLPCCLSKVTSEDWWLIRAFLDIWEKSKTKLYCPEATDCWWRTVWQTTPRPLWTWQELNWGCCHSLGSRRNVLYGLTGLGSYKRTDLGPTSVLSCHEAILLFQSPLHLPLWTGEGKYLTAVNEATQLPMPDNFHLIKGKIARDVENRFNMQWIALFFFF